MAGHSSRWLVNAGARCSSASSRTRAGGVFATPPIAESSPEEDIEPRRPHLQMSCSRRGTRIAIPMRARPPGRRFAYRVPAFVRRRWACRVAKRDRWDAGPWRNGKTRRPGDCGNVASPLPDGEDVGPRQYSASTPVRACAAKVHTLRADGSSNAARAAVRHVRAPSMTPAAVAGAYAATCARGNGRRGRTVRRATVFHTIDHMRARAHRIPSRSRSSLISATKPTGRSPLSNQRTHVST